MNFRKILLLTLALLLSQSISAASDVRYALIIGNSNYQHASLLTNPQNDSRDIASTLGDLDFEIILLQDATKKQIDSAVKKFLTLLKQEGGVGLFFYAGHGVQLHGDNYLLPVEVQTGSDTEIKKQSFNIADLLSGMRKIKTATNIIILDACRDNPFKALSKKVNTKLADVSNDRGLNLVEAPTVNAGLSKLNAPANTLIAFATA